MTNKILMVSTNKANEKFKLYGLWVLYVIGKAESIDFS